LKSGELSPAVGLIKIQWLGERAAGVLALLDWGRGFRLDRAGRVLQHETGRAGRIVVVEVAEPRHNLVMNPGLLEQALESGLDQLPLVRADLVVAGRLLEQAVPALLEQLALLAQELEQLLVVRVLALQGLQALLVLEGSVLGNR